FESRVLLAALPPEGLVSWYRAEDNPAGTVAKDWADGNDGTLQGTVGFAAGEVGQAFSFDGNIANRVSVPVSASLDLTQFTVDAWIFPTSNTGGTIINKEGANGIKYARFFVAVSLESDHDPGNK